MGERFQRETPRCILISVQSSNFMLAKQIRYFRVGVGHELMRATVSMMLRYHTNNQV